jgi:glucoside 3-dehydrogenase (cytochrome c) hitch-hiker subunit
MTHETGLSMTRREAVLRVGALLGGAALVGQSALLEGCTGQGPRADAGALLSSADVELLAEIADAILPETSTPGAKAAGVGPFIATMVADAYDPTEQRIFIDGLRTLERRCRADYGAEFPSARPEQRIALLERLDREAYEAYAAGRADENSPHPFRMLKELTLLGYFTSEIGYTQAQRYAETPGRFDPCVRYESGEKAWAVHA